MKKLLIMAFAASAFAACCNNGGVACDARNLDRAKATLDSIYAHYGVAENRLLRENYPFNVDYTASYLASADQARPNPYSYLWPFSGTLSAVNTILEADASYRSVLDGRVLPGLAEYLDTTRMPAAYASYINTASASDRFYDDNVWLGIDFCDIYEATGDKKYLAEAEMIWKFIESGTDDVLGGGIYWCEQQKHSKNTCSNAPGTVYALKLYAATGDERYLARGKALYAWTKEHLLDPEDGLYFDNIGLDGRIGRAKFAYNSGQMVQAGALLYKATGDESYLKDAQRTAAACYDRFFGEFTPQGGETFRIIDKGNDGARTGRTLRHRRQCGLSRRRAAHARLCVGACPRCAGAVRDRLYGGGQAVREVAADAGRHGRDVRTHERRETGPDKITILNLHIATK